MGIFDKISESFSCCRKQRPENRTVHVGHHRPPGEDVAVIKPDEKFPTNRVVSSKYTMLNFIPKNLFEQFQRIANFYFLCVGLIELSIDSPVSPLTTILPLCFVLIVTAIKQLFIDSPVSPIASILPLAFVISVTAIKQGYEDVLRHRADREVNYRPANVLKDGKFQECRSKDIRVGDIVKVASNEGIPCDMVMLSSEDCEGECYITTANLDGETSLKTFNCVSDTRHLQTDDSFHNFRATIECEQPIVDLYKFVGRITIHKPDGDVTRSLGPENVLLRGSRLKNTLFVYGCTIYTGQETKISLNSEGSTTKFSRIERSMNYFLIVLLVVLVIEAAVLTGLKEWWYSDSANTVKSHWYGIPENEMSARVAVEEFLSFMVLTNYIIPISMYVTVEMQKFFGSMFFQWDVEMYDAQSNEPAKANTSDLNEELGQVEYLFTDKTGTLTENDMQFRQCSVGGVKYIEVGGMLCELPDIPDCQPTPMHSLTTELEELFTVLVVCHTVRIDRQNPGSGYSESGFEYDYQASSPDEKALVEACRRYGVVYHGVHDDKMEVTFKGHMRRYTLVHLLDFDPTRKRMSVIVKDESGDAFLLCKGAETAILDRIAEGDVDTIEKHVTDYALLGLRTLVIAHKKLTTDEFRHFDELLMAARKALDNRQEKLDSAFDEVERDLTLLGVTAVEDRLQEGVPETIEALRKAGIQVWVLTGDKEETAINVSYSAGHFFRGVVEVRLTQQPGAVECATTLGQIEHVLSEATKYGDKKKHALVIDGISLAYALRDNVDLLQRVCSMALTVLCCRMSPIQKALVVRLMKESPGSPVTAAIGDGANDVSMIQEAHVGLGVMGKEGRQAVRSSDYAFGRFAFIKKALLVHGHYFYIRLATLVQYFFFKNVAFITSQIYFCFFSAFSAQTIYETFFLTFYNITFTSLPILIYGLFEQHVEPEILIQKPELYKTIRKNARLTVGQFCKWMALGLYHSIVCFFGVYGMFYWDSSLMHDGKGFGVYDFGTMVYTNVVFSVNIKLMLEWYHWDVFTVLSFVISFAGLFVMSIVYSLIIWTWAMSEWPMYGSMLQIWGQPSVWLGHLVIVTLALLPDIVLRATNDTFSVVYQHQSRKKGVFYETNKMSISFTKRSGTLTISQMNIVDA